MQGWGYHVTPLRLIVLAVCLAVSSTAQAHQMSSTHVTGTAIRDAAAQRLYFLSISNMDSDKVSDYFHYNLGFQPADVAAAVKEIAEFRKQYGENTAAFNATVGDGTGFSESLQADFQAHQAVITSDALEELSSSLSKPAFRVLLADIRSAKNKMVVNDPSAGIPNAMTCCYSVSETDAMTVLSTSPMHVTLTHTLTIEGNVQLFIPPRASALPIPLHFPRRAYITSHGD